MTSDNNNDRPRTNQTRIDQPGADQQWVYAGFWIRVWASLIDSVLLLFVLFPLLSLIPGIDNVHHESGRLFTPSGQIDYDALSLMPTLPGPLHILLYWVLPAAVIVLFWIAREATPGKMAIHARIVDARRGTKPTKWQYVVRYLGYYVSTIPLGLGLIWVGIDARKQGWHDKLANTVVVRPRALVTGEAKFEGNRNRPIETGWKNE